MATIAQILPEFFPGNTWRIDEDDYATLEWFGPDPKPDEATIRANSAATDVILAERARLQRQQEAFYVDPDDLLKAFEITTDGLAEIRRVILALAPSAPFDPDVVSRIQNLRQRLDDLRDIT